MRYRLYPFGLNNGANVTRYQSEASAKRAWCEAGKTCPDAILYDGRTKQWLMTYREALAAGVIT